MKRYAIIVAAGTGSRMKAGLPKQFMILSGKPVLFYSLDAFFRHDPDTTLIVVISNEEKERWQQLCTDYEITIPHQLVEGGDTRTDSVRNGLTLVSSGLVAIHDGARPLVTPELIEKCFTSALEKGSGVAAVPSKDSLRKVNGQTNQAVPREDYRLIQTPQTFNLNKLKAAFESFGPEVSSDDATIFERSGFDVSLVEGDYTNLKITTPEDILVAELFMKDIRRS